MPRPRLPRVSETPPRRRVAAGLALIVAVAVVLVVVLSAGSSSPASAGSNPTVSGAATVERHDLVETDTEAGTLSYSNPQTVYNRLSGTVTWLPTVGQEIKPGGTLFRVDGKPVILMNGTTPAYRDLGPSDSDGADITELNRNLVALGFNPDGIVVDDVWQAATTAGVELFQESLGETATGTLSLGQVVFLPGDQLITTVDGTLGSGTPASTTADPPAPEFVSLDTRTSCPTTDTTSTTTCPTSTTPATTPTGSHHHPKSSSSKQTLESLIATLEREIAQLQAEQHSSPGAHNSGSSPGSTGNHGNSGSGTGNHGNGGSGSGGSGNGGSGNGGSGNGWGSGGVTPTAILQTTSTQLVVTVDLSASSQSEASVGEHVMVEMPNSTFVPGKITAVSSVAQNSDNGNGNGNGGNGNGNGNGNNGNGNGNGNGNSSSSTIPVTITLSGHVSGAGLDQAAVSVNFVEAKVKNVLAVPVTALLAQPGGTYAVQEAAAPHKLLPVTTGLFAAGQVQIAGPGIYQGLQVTDSQG